MIFNDRPLYYKLVGKIPVACSDIEEYIEQQRKGQFYRHVAQTRLKDDTRISTVFLGIDHSFAFDEDSPPILFETMIFGGKYNEFQWRYVTWEDAEEGHKVAVDMAQSKVTVLTIVFSRFKRFWYWLESLYYIIKSKLQ